MFHLYQMVGAGSSSKEDASKDDSSDCRDGKGTFQSSRTLLTQSALRIQPNPTGRALLFYFLSHCISLLSIPKTAICDVCANNVLWPLIFSLKGLPPSGCSLRIILNFRGNFFVGTCVGIFAGTSRRSPLMSDDGQSRRVRQSQTAHDSSRDCSLASSGCLKV